MDEQARRAETDRAFEGLYRRHRVDVYRAAMRKTHDHHEAEDVTQTAFLDAYRAVLTGTRPELPRPWLLAIAENIRRRRFAASIRRPRPVPLEEDTVASPAGTRVEAESVLAALETLAPNQRSAFLLREVAGLSYAEIAAQLEVSLPAVQMLLFRARQSLRILLAAPDEKSSRVYSPAWLSWLSTRWDAGSAGAGAGAFGAAGAAAVVVAGVGGAAPAPAQRPASVAQTRPALVVKHEVQRAESAAPVVARAGAKQPDPQRPKPTRAATRAAAPTLVRAQAAPSAAPSPSVDPGPGVDLGPGPVAPSATPAAAAAGSDGPSAPALVPTSTTLDAVVQPVSVPEVVTVPVLVPPPVEGAEVPALEVPTVPAVPVAVGITPPVLPGP